MSDRSNELDGFLAEVSDRVEHDVAVDELQPDFEAMLARAQELSQRGLSQKGLASEQEPAEQPLSEPDPALAELVSEVATHLMATDEAVPDFLAVVSRAHAIAPETIPQSAVDEVGQYAPIISLKHAGRLKTGQHDPALDTFVGDVRGHVDHELVRARVRRGSASGETDQGSHRRGGFGIAIAAGLVLALGVGAGLATAFDLGGGLWSAEGDAPNEAMLSPRPAVEQESQLAGGLANGAASNVEPVTPAPRPDPTSATPPPQPQPQPQLSPAPVQHARPKRRARTPSRRERLAALERDANAAWQARKLDKAEATFRKIIAIDGRGSWGESAYGELFTLQRQRGRSSVALWKAYLKRFPDGRFADDARAGLCRRAGDDTKAACWSAYLEAMPRGSFRAQAHRELAAAREKETP
ncbi:MAG: tetratricopeptide repeat protein [Nannocystales bacterium]